MKQITTVEMLVTPAIARDWLQRNTQNRDVVVSQVCHLAEEIRSGNWIITPDSIAFDVLGKLVNGQHRLLAVVTAGIPVKMLVTQNLPIGSYDATDQGVRRSVADAIKQPKDLVRVLNIILHVMSGHRMKYQNSAIKHLCLQVGDTFELIKKHAGAGANNKNTTGKTIVFAAALYAYLDALDRSDKNATSFILEKVRCWFSNENPMPISMTVLTFLSEAKNRLVLDSAFLKVLNLFDSKNQASTKLYAKNKEFVRARILEILDIPAAPKNIRGKFNAQTGDFICSKQEKAIASKCSQEG